MECIAFRATGCLPRNRLRGGGAAAMICILDTQTYVTPKRTLKSKRPGQHNIENSATQPNFCVYGSPSMGKINGTRPSQAVPMKILVGYVDRSHGSPRPPPSMFDAVLPIQDRRWKCHIGWLRRSARSHSLLFLPSFPPPFFCPHYLMQHT